MEHERRSGKACLHHGHGSPVARNIHSLSSHGSSAIPFIATECSQGTAGGYIARRTLLTSSGRAFPRVAGDGAGANRQKSGVEGPRSRATNHRSVCVSLTWALFFHRRWLPARRARRRVAEATVRGRPCNEQHCIRAANPRAHFCHGVLLLLLWVESEKQKLVPSTPFHFGHDSHLKTKPFVIPEFYRHREPLQPGGQ